MNEAEKQTDENNESADAQVVETDAVEGNEKADKLALEAVQLELAETKERMLRALAEAENTRKRSERVQQDASKFAVAGFAKDMLDVADNMRRALDSIPTDQLQENETLKTLFEGIEATQSVMLRAFEKHGIETLAPESGRFDPNNHEVMFEAEMPGEVPGTIIQLLEPGYVLNGRLLRPARVGVSKGGDPSGHAVDTKV